MKKQIENSVRFSARRRKHEKAMKAAATMDELRAAKGAAESEGQSAYRHFDLEILGELYRRRTTPTCDERTKRC